MKHGMRTLVGILSATWFAACGGSGSNPPTSQDAGTPPVGGVFELKSAAFADTGSIPARHSQRGGNVSPPLSWSGAPASVQSFAVTCTDADAFGYVHWVVYDIPATVTALAENLPKTPTLTSPPAMQGANDTAGTGWAGLDPPPGEEHRYVFTLYALGTTTLGLAPGARLTQVTQAMQGKIISQASLRGRYSP